jgi:HAD superfamily hydrolase (TIGR01459 family)
MANSPVSSSGTDGNTGSPRISGLSEIAPDYRLVLCDVWGVLHNGVRAWPAAIEALSNFRKGGGTVVMITNAPRPHGPVIEQLARLGVPEGTFDGVVTSGDVTRELMKQAPANVFHIGPAKDDRLFEGIHSVRVAEEEAEAIVCTGPFNDMEETPEDYREMMQRLARRDLPFICANPDLVVEVGDRLIYCAGALAALYEEFGGTTRIAGKPYPPIYEAAIALAEEMTGSSFARNEILAIGDGMPTDIKGAADFGLDVLYVSAGIHAAEYGDADNPDPEKLQAFLDARGASPVAWIPRLCW